jgi:hypothetical protein
MKADTAINTETPWSYVEQEYYLKKRPPIQKEGD